MASTRINPKRGYSRSMMTYTVTAMMTANAGRPPPFDAQAPKHPEAAPVALFCHNAHDDPTTHQLLQPAAQLPVFNSLAQRKLQRDIALPDCPGKVFLRQRPINPGEFLFAGVTAYAP